MKGRRGMSSLGGVVIVISCLRLLVSHVKWVGTGILTIGSKMDDNK